MKKKILCIVLAVVIVVGIVVVAVATSGKCGGDVKWRYNLFTGTLTIYGKGEMESYSSLHHTFPGIKARRPRWHIFCDSIKNVIIEDGVTSVGCYAFEDYTNLTSITLPDSLTTIRQGAFCGTGYYTKEFNWENNALYVGKCLIDVKPGPLNEHVIKNGTSIIADYALASCASLTNITIPNSVTSIGDNAFYYCDNLTSITLGDGVTKIGKNAFTGCSNLTSITIPDSVTSIEDYWFVSCTSLVRFEVSANNIAYSSEDGVLFNKDKTTLIQHPQGKASTSYTVPNSVTTIGNYAFYNCKSLTSITIPDSVTSIEDYWFASCTSLARFEVSANNIAYSSEDGVLFNKDKTTLIQHPQGKASTSYTVPNSVTTIGNYAFYNCKSLTNITVPNSVTTIGNYAFYTPSLCSLCGNKGSYVERWAYENKIYFEVLYD